MLTNFSSATSPLGNVSTRVMTATSTACTADRDRASARRAAGVGDRRRPGEADQIHPVRFVRPARRIMQQPIEPRQSIGSDQAELAVDDRRSHGQALEVLDHAGQTLGVFGAALSVEAYSIAIHRHLESIAIPGSCSQSGPRAGRTALAGT